MARKTCWTCGGSGMEYRPQNETCSGCGGSGKAYGYGQLCIRCGGSGTVSINRNVTCRACGGAGSFYEPDPVSYSSKSKPAKRGSGRKRPSKSGSGSKTNAAQFVVTLAGFFAGAYFTYQNTEENIILAFIVGIIAGYLAGKWYKALIVIAVIIGAIYFFTNRE